MKIILIEDEKHIANDLATTLQAINSEIEILEILHSVATATAYFNQKNDADLIFSDIQLGDGLSFEVFEKVNTNIPIIFCTAYNEYALEAFKNNGIDYVLKPFSRKTIGLALDKYEQLKEKLATPKNDYMALMQLITQQNQTIQQVKPKSIIVKKGERYIPIDFSQIALFYVEDNYTFVHTFEQKRYLVSQKLEQLEVSAGINFYRTNRQFLVNRKAIKEATQYFNRKLLINLTFSFSEQITVGKLKVTDFLDWLAK